MAVQDKYQRIVPFILFIIALFLLFLIIQPMINILLGSILLAYISFPLYKRITRKIPNKSISIILSLSIVLIIALLPFAFLVFEISEQGYYFYNSLSDGIEKGALLGFACTSSESEVCSLLNRAERFSVQRLSVFDMDIHLKNAIQVIKEKISIFILSIPIIIAEIFLTIVIAYFILKDWRNILKKIIDLLPMRKKTIKRLITEFGNIAYTVVYAQLFVAFIQGLVATIGFYIFGVPFPMFLGVVVAFCALIPTIGTALIWFPASLFLILSGYFSNNYWILGKGVGLFLYGLFIISTIDNILLAKIVKAKANVNQIIVIIGVVGGASLFGIVGIFVGPILLPLLITYFQTFNQRFA